MSIIRVIISKDGRVAVDLEMLDDAACDAADAELRAVLELLGAGFCDAVEDPPAPRQPNGVPEGTRTKGSG